MAQELTYTEVNGYLIPDLALPDDGLGDVHIGIWGQRRLDYLKTHKRLLHMELLTTGKLRAHLHEIDVAASERKELLTTQMAAAEGVTEDLKAQSQMLWVGKMNNIRNRVEEIIYNELIYA